MDFMFDELASDWRIKTLTVINDYTKESVRIIANTPILAVNVAPDARSDQDQARPAQGNSDR